MHWTVDNALLSGDCASVNACKEIDSTKKRFIAGLLLWLVHVFFVLFSFCCSRGLSWLVGLITILFL